VIQEDLNWADKIIVTLGVRFDKSTLNADQDKFYTFPRASFAANLHNLFGEDGQLGFFDQLKFRVAYGETGGLATFGNTFESLSPQLIGGSLGAQVGTRGIDPDLVPETAQEIEFGVDASFLDNRISVEASYYNKNVKDLIFNITPPESVGITQIATNAGDLQNKGFELSLGINSIRSENVNMFSRFIYYANDSEITRWDAPVQTTGGFGPALGTYIFAEGFSPTAIVGNPSGTEDTPLGFTLYGDRQPDFSMSFYNELNILKNLDFNFLFHYQKGGNAINLSALLWDDGGTTPNWNADEDGDGTFDGLQRLLDWAVNGNTGAYIEPTSYVKLREVGLYYTLPKGILGGDVFDRLKIGVSANNILLWTNYGSYDPEVSNFGTQPVTGNIEVTPYPSSRRLFFHVKADF
jgi:outer membrane receptor protein involved in Fe transport